MMPRAIAADTARRSKDSSSFAQDFGIIVRRPAIHALFWSYLICGFTSSGAIESHFLPFADFCGFPPMQSASAYCLLSLVNLFGMIGAGRLTDRMNRPTLLAAIHFLRALTYVILINLPGTGIEVLFMFAIFFGVMDYSTVLVTASLATSHIGIKVMGQTMGMISAGHALGSAAAANLGGYPLDATSSFEMLWPRSLWLLFEASLLALLVLAMKPSAPALAT